jgi:hypothetical protein
MSINNKAGQTLAKQVPASESGIITVSVDAPATVESLAIRIYPGAENTLRLRPVVKSSGAESDILDYGGKSYVDGDDDDWEWDVSEPVGADDEIGIRYDNTDGSNAHNFRATVDVDYRGGLESIIDGVVR